jgi:hypothetical protein
MTLHVERPVEEGKEGEGEEEALGETGGGEEESGSLVSLSLPPPRPPSHPQFQDLRTREPVDPARRLDYVFTTAGKVREGTREGERAGQGREGGRTGPGAGRCDA